MLVQQSGPHVVKHLQSRVDSLKAALDAAQDRINELERALGIGDDLTPLRLLGLGPQEAAVVNLLMKRSLVTRHQLLVAIYADNEDRRFDVMQTPLVGAVAGRARMKLNRLGVTFASLYKQGQRSEAGGYRMSGADKARLAKLIASGARLVTRGRPDRKHYKRATRGAESRAMHG